MKDAGIFLGREEKQRVAKKGLGEFLGYAKKVVIFLGKQILKLWFLGIKYEPLSPPPLPSLKFVSGTPGFPIHPGL